MFDVIILKHGPVVTKLVGDDYYAISVNGFEMFTTASLEIAHELHREVFERLVKNS